MVLHNLAIDLGESHVTQGQNDVFDGIYYNNLRQLQKDPDEDPYQGGKRRTSS